MSEDRKKMSSDTELIVTKTIVDGFRINLPKRETRKAGFKIGDVVEVRLKKKTP